MQLEIGNWSSLGTLEELYALAKIFSVSSSLTLHDLIRVSLSNPPSWRTPPKALLYFFELLEVCENDTSHYVLSCPELLDHLSAHNIFAHFICCRFCEMVATKSELRDIIPISAVRYEPSMRTFGIQTDQLATHLSGLKNTLLNLGFLYSSLSIQNHVFVSEEYRWLFKNRLLPSFEAKELEVARAKLSLADLLRLNQLKSDQGAAAEAYVMSYEKKRLGPGEAADTVEQVSLYDVGAGYDIASYDSATSKLHDRYIEVKSHRSNPHFFLSSNELERAGILGMKYFVYLVDLNLIELENYHPWIINDVDLEIFHSSLWSVKEASWHCSFIA